MRSHEGTAEDCKNVPRRHQRQVSLTTGEKRSDVDNQTESNHKITRHVCESRGMMMNTPTHTHTHLRFKGP